MELFKKNGKFALLTSLALHLLILRPTNGVKLGQCDFTERTNLDPKVTTLLSSLISSIFTTEDTDYKYTVTICGQIPDKQGAAALQTKKSDGKGFTLGQLSDADVMYGDEWVALTFSSGDNYGSLCGTEKRQATVMIMCDPEEAFGKLRFIHEEATKNKTSDCSYLFELDHASLCTSDIAVSCNSLLIAGMSVGSILVICFLSIALAYLLIGIAYKHFVVGATGIEKLPNYEFWRNCGELQADGCDFVFRTGNINFEPLSVSADEPREPANYSSARTATATAVTQQPNSARSNAAQKPYRGQPPRGAYETEAERDANILPM